MAVSLQLYRNTWRKTGYPLLRAHIRRGKLELSTYNFTRAMTQYHVSHIQQPCIRYNTY